MPPTTPSTETVHTETVRLVLLGASNVARCLPTAVHTARAIAGENHPELPARTWVATGRGRSYGQTSWLLGRSLPGILQSGLWQALDDAPDGPTYAVLTDIGNDVVYGADPDVILSWLEACLRRLGDHTRFAVTALPLDNLDRFPIAFLEAFRRALFPSASLPVSELIHRAEILDDGLRALCAERDLPLIEQPETWFHLDPVHYRLRRRKDIWNQILAPWRDQGPPTSKPRRHIFWRAWPERSAFLGRGIARRQPCLHLGDGTPVSLY